LKTSLEEITDQLSDLGKTCDAWGKDATCDNAPTWQLRVRHTVDGGPGCPPVVCLLCDECLVKCHKTLDKVPPGMSLQCSYCLERGLHVPDSFILSEERI
jgi:hypothetical protein